MKSSPSAQSSPKTWTGAGVDRVDGALKVTGRAFYAAEFAVAGLTHAVIVPSPITVGRVVAVEDTAARAIPGVLAVLHVLAPPRLPSRSAGAHPPEAGPLGRVLQLLQDDQILYNDHPVAVVVAESEDIAHEAAGKLSLRFEARTQAPRIEMGDAGATIYTPKKVQDGPPDTKRGDFEAAFAAAPPSTKLDVTYTTPRQNHNPMEPHATTAVWHAADQLTVYDSTQGIFGVRKRLADLFGLPPAAVRVLSPFVGGGFGCKGAAWSHVALAALAAKTVQRPVRLVVKRSQMFSLVGHRPPTQQRLRVAAHPDGTLLALGHDVLSHTSTFDEFVELSTLPTRMLYACPDLQTTQRLVRLDVPTPTFMRAPGESTGTFALECALDELSYALKIDPVLLRLKNHADRDPEKDKPWSSKSLKACYHLGAERFGWSHRKPQPRATRDGRFLVGWGMATATYPAKRDKASAAVTLGQDGRALVQAGTQDIGTGTYTVMSQIAADALAMSLDRVQFELGDTRLPSTPVSGGSRTAASVGSAVKEVGLELRRALLALARSSQGSPHYQAPEGSLETRDGRIFDRSQPERNVGYGELLKLAGKDEMRAEVEAQEDPKSKDAHSCHSFGAQFAEVRVDEDLGEVRVSRFVGVFGVGQVLNAKTARSQLQGGIIWGIGFALHEHTVLDPRSGRVMTRDLSDYHVPVQTDVPPVDVVFVPEDDPFVNPIGAKGIGEIGITGSAAAVANAVFHATGKRIRDLPITPDKLL